jgi:hypothetical protein
MLTTTGVFASWVSTAQSTTGTQTAATVTATHTDTNGTVFSTAVGTLLPGDYLYRYANLVNTGDVTQTFSAAISGSGTLAGAGGLQIAVDSCSVAWAANGSCSGTTTAVLANADVASAGSASLGSLSASGTSRLRYKISLNSSAVQATFQGTTGTVTVAITGTATGNRDRTAG